MAAMKRSGANDLLLGEWACLGIVCVKPSHGFAISGRLAPTGDVGRVWSLSRALTYRALDQLAAREMIRATGEEPGIAGGNRTILAPTRQGRAAMRGWLTTPTEHLRDLRSELLLKLILADLNGTDPLPLLVAQRERVAGIARALDDQLDRSQPGADVVTLWRSESAAGALRFLDRLIGR